MASDCRKLGKNEFSYSLFSFTVIIKRYLGVMEYDGVEQKQ